MSTQTRIIDAVDVAKMLRKALRGRYPDTTFSVRTKRYAGGASIDVTYTDGPPLDELEALCDRYQGADFDGMRDLKTIRRTVLADEEGQPEEVMMGVDFIHVHRHYSTATMEAVAQEEADAFGMEVPEISPPTEYRGAMLTGDAANAWTGGEHGLGRRFSAHVLGELRTRDLTEEAATA